MARQIIDLSIYLENDVISDPPGFGPKFKYFAHEDTFLQVEPFFPGLCKSRVIYGPPRIARQEP